MTSTRKKIGRKGSERGIALVVTLLILMLVSAIAAGMLIASNTETNISGNFRDEQTAFFGARAGLEEVRDRLRVPAANSLDASLPPNLIGNSNAVLYITNPTGSETVAPWTTGGSNYPDTEICQEQGVTCSGGIPAGSPWYTTGSASTSYAASPKLPWKWVRIVAKTNRMSGSVNGSQTNNNRVCWNGTSELTTAASDCGANSPVYTLTALAATPSGSRRMVQAEFVKNINVPVVGAMYAMSNIDTGQALNVTGNTDSVCNLPSRPGAVSGTSTVTTPGGGNVTGTPVATVNNYGWNVNLPGTINSLSPGALQLTNVTGVTHDASSPPNYNLPTGTLGTVPAVTYSGSDNITAITAPGIPATYVSPDLLIPNSSPPQYRTFTMGGGGSGVSGQGVLLVRGNLTMDFGQTWDYFGLIVVQGNLTMINTGNGNANPHIHGAILVGGSISASGQGMGNFNGSISIHQNACMVNNALGPQFYKSIALRELMN